MVWCIDGFIIKILIFQFLLTRSAECESMKDGGISLTHYQKLFVSQNSFCYGHSCVIPTCTEDPTHRCLDCGTLVFYCAEHSDLIHQFIRFYKTQYWDEEVCMPIKTDWPTLLIISEDSGFLRVFRISRFHLNLLICYIFCSKVSVIHQSKNLSIFYHLKLSNMLLLRVHMMGIAVKIFS